MSSTLISFGGKVLGLSGGGLIGFPQREQLPWNSFTDIGDVYDSLLPGEKVAFVIRHSEREESGDRNLTQAGIQYARDTGAKLAAGIAGTTDVALYSSPVQRCVDTATYIGEGSGRTLQSPTILSGLEGCPYEDTKPSEGWEDYSLFAYDLSSIHGGTFHAKTTITPQILSLVQNNMTNALNIFVTHDQLLEIFVVDMCNQEISLKFWSGAVNDGINEERWITYLAGLAIIRHTDGTYEWGPVKSLSRGYQTSYNNIYVP